MAQAKLSFKPIIVLSLSSVKSISGLTGDHISGLTENLPQAMSLIGAMLRLGQAASRGAARPALANHTDSANQQMTVRVRVLYVLKAPSQYLASSFPMEVPIPSL